MEFKFWIIVLRIQVTIGNDSWMTGNSVPRLDLSFGFIVLHCNCHDRQASYGFPLLDRRIVSIFLNCILMFHLDFDPDTNTVGEMI